MNGIPAHPTTIRRVLILALCAGLWPGAPAGTQVAPIVPAMQILAPIHSHPRDPSFGEYGVWAAGPDYKVSFHDGFVFHPVLGRAAPEGLPLRWRTESVMVGDALVVHDGQVPEHPATAWRYEYRYPGLVEAYDVGAPGVEQTFTLTRRPTGTGDWTVVGRVATRLRCDLTPARHGALTFGDNRGSPVIRYGAAFAVDAAGDRVPATTAFDGQRVRLVVDGAWLAQACYPVVLDPLTSRTAITNASVQLTDVEVGIEYESTGNNTLFVFTRWTSSQDPDAFGVLASNGNLGPFNVVFSDVVATLRSEKTTCAFVGGADRWVIAFQRSPTSNTVSQIRLWVHDKTVGNMSGGSMMFLGLTAAGTTDREPDVGGTTSGTQGNDALLVYQTDVTATNGNTLHTEVHGVLVDAAAKTFATPFVVANAPVGTRWDREHPSVNQASFGGSSSWVVAWQEMDHSILNAVWSILVQRITPAGVRAASANVSAPIDPAARHLIRPAVAGRDGRYMVTYLRSVFSAWITGPRLGVTRFDAMDNLGTIQVLGFNHVATAAGPLEFADPALAFDPGTRSHWALTWHDQGSLPGNAYVARLGFTGGTVESAVVDTQGGQDLDVTWDPAGGFLLGYASGVPAASIWAQRLLYPREASTAQYGTSCGGTIGAGTPHAGSEFFGLTLSGAWPSTAAILLLAAGPASIDLASVGMPGCTFLVDPALFFALPAATSASGVANLRISLPDDPLFVGDLCFQWLYLQPGANAAGLLATRGMRALVR